MIFSEKILKLYKTMMFSRCDDEGTAYYFSADDFDGLKKESYSFKNASGDRLQGYFYSYPDAAADRLVIFDHGMGGGHRSYMKEIERLAKAGYTVFSYDHTGCMESEGGSTNGFARSISDLDHALTALKSDEKYKNLKISVMGHSWGALAVQNICAFHPDVAHIIAMSGPVSVTAAIDQFFGGPLRLYRKDIMKLEREANPDYYSCNAAEALLNYNGHALLIHSEDDKTVLKKNHFDVLESALSGKDNIRFLLVNGKGHNPNYTADASEYLQSYIAERNDKTKKGLLSTDGQKKTFVDSFDWNRMTAQDDSVWEEILKTLKK